MSKFRLSRRSLFWGLVALLVFVAFFEGGRWIGVLIAERHIERTDSSND